MSQHSFLLVADDVNYFVSGKGDMEAYDPECLFADPFAGFNGVDRFKQNVSNLGGLMSVFPASTFPAPSKDPF